MGIFDSIGNIVRGQLIDVIEWTDSTNNTIVHKYDMNGKEIMMGAQLTVRESQVAIFVNEGKLADVFQPGRYELSTANMPVMTALKAWKFGFNSPFKSDVYFVNTKQFLDCKWGTTNPVMMRDAEFGMIRLRAFGAYSFRVADPEVFLREVFGTSSEYTVQDAKGSSSARWCPACPTRLRKASCPRSIWRRTTTKSAIMRSRPSIRALRSSA